MVIIKGVIYARLDTITQARCRLPSTRHAFVPTMKTFNNSVIDQEKTGNQKSSERDDDENPPGFSKFCQQTSLHGWAYLDSEHGFLRRFVWIAVMGAVCIASGYFLIRNSDEFAKARTVTSIDSTTASLADIIFPSIFICNVNQVSRSFLVPLGASESSEKALLLFNQFIDGTKKSANLSDFEKDSLANMTQNLKSFYQWNDSIPFIRLSSQNCTEMIIFLEWRSSNFQKFYNAYQSVTDYGACCLIVPYLDLVNEATISLEPESYTGDHFHSIPRGAKNGIQNGLRLVLDVESYDYAYFPRGAKGFRIAMSAATDQAVINQDGFYISPGTEILAALTPSVLNTSERAISRFSSDERDCYLDSEFKFPNLKWDDGYRYSIKNCLYESVLQNILLDCKCMPTFAKKNPKHLQTCMGVNQTCALKWLDLMGNEPDPGPDLTITNNSYDVPMKCRQRCDLQTEAMMTTTSDFPNRETFPFRQEYCFVLQKMSKICNNSLQREIFEGKYKTFTCKEILTINGSQICNANNEANALMVQSKKDFTEFMFQYAAENFAVLYIFIKDPYYTLILKDESMSVISFIGNAGGLVGLSMGLSFVSVFEVFYHCFSFCFSRGMNLFHRQ